MPSNNKNIIGDLRGKFDPHYKLASNVEGLEKGLATEVSQLHKTLSKSFGMQRKTLTRVLGLEGRLSNLEVAIEAWTMREGMRRQELEKQIEEVVEDVIEDEDEEEIPEGLDDTLDDIRGEGEPRGTAILDGEGISDGPDGGSRGTSILGPDPTKKKKKPKAKKKPKIRAKKRKIKSEDIRKGTPTSTLDGEKKKIKADDIKKGTVLDDDFKSRVLGEDADGEYLSKEERIARFKGETFNPESVKSPDEDSSSEEGTSEGEGKAENVLSGMGKSISTIADTVDSIFNTLKEQFEEQKDTKEDARVKKEQKDAEKDEKKLEGKGKIGKALEGTSKKAMAPFQSIWSKFVNFLTTILFGKALMKIMDWFGNPENADKIKSFVRFLRDWWPVLLASAMAFLPALFGTGGMIIGTVVLIAWALPKVINAVKWLMGLPGQIGKFLMGGDKENQKLDKEVDAEFTDAGKSLNKEIGMSTDSSQDEKEVKSDPRQQAEKEQGKEKAPVDIEKQQEQQKPVGLNKGGTVPGKGDKDTVPAMLTPGEFVMTKGAVEKFGVDTLEGMNAAAGGTNIPVVQVEEKKKKERGMGMGGIRGSIPAYSEGGTAKAIPQESMIPGTNGQATPMTSEEIVAATGPSLMMFMKEQNAAVDENPEAYNGIKLKLDRDGKMPNFGEFIMAQGEAEFHKGLEMLQNNDSIEPEVKEALIKKALYIKGETLDNPNFKADIAFDINKDIPGTAANRLFLKAQADTTSIAAKGGISARDRALLMNRRGMSGGGLVQNFALGGLVQNLPQVKAAKFLGGGIFKGIKNIIGKGKEVLGGGSASGGKGADGPDGGGFSSFLSKVSKVPLVGPMLVSAGKDLVDGITELKMSSKTLKTSDIAPPSGKNVKVINQKSSSPSSAASPAPMIGSGDIPDFAVVHPARRTAKQKTLGITN